MNCLKNTKLYLSNIRNNVLFSIKFSFKASKTCFILKFVILTFTSIIPIISMWIWKVIINEISMVSTNEGIRVKKVFIGLIIYLVIQVITELILSLDTYVINKSYDEINFYIQNLLISKTSRMDLSFFDSADMSDKLRNGRNSLFILHDASWYAFNILSELINVIITLVIISNFNIYIGFLTIILLIPYMLYNKKHFEKMLKIEKEHIRDNRKMEYYKYTFLDSNIQFEIKLNNIGNYFIKKHQEIWNKLYKINRDEDVKHNFKSMLIMLLNVSSEFLVFIISISQVLSKKIGIGDIQYNLSIVSRLREQVTKLMSDLNQLLIYNSRLNDVQEFIKVEPVIEKSGTLVPSNNPKIEFCNVSFKYPNSEDYILKNCSFTIEPNEKVGLIGINGAGKSTIVKLMVRFYDPTEGVIKLDGIDLKEYDVYKVRNIFGILFQDYVTYCLPFREIVALSDFKNVENDEKIKSACDISGVSNFIKDWKDGYDTVLGRYYEDDGKDLSGGQWQLVGLARAYFKDTEYMILDEPSASLDPISEDRIFEQLYKLSLNKSSLTISHRLSNTTLADRILVLENGKIIEEGSHNELLQASGRYAHLFNLQSKRYVD